MVVKEICWFCMETSFAYLKNFGLCVRCAVTEIGYQKKSFLWGLD